MSNEDDEEEMVQVVVNVPRSVKETAKQKLPYGGMTEEVRDTLTRIAFGEDMNQRSRLEHQLEELREVREEKRRERREIETEIENLDSRITGVEQKISKLSSKEERYEAKLESLEHRVRSEGRLFPEHGAVRNVASEAQVEPEGVIQDLMDRNPDVPDYAFEEKTPYADEPDWYGLPDEDVDTPVEQRVAKYR